MPQIILDSAQAQIVLQSREPVRVCGPEGDLLGTLAPATKNRTGGKVSTDEEIEQAKRALAAPGPRYTTQQVIEQLRAMKPEN